MTDRGTPGMDLADDEESADALVPIREEVRLGRYQLRYELGSGGMATVYLARAEGPGRFAKAVAIKRIHPHLARRRGFVDMFLDEARIASSISHPNVCATFDFGEIDGEYFMAMEYLAGEPLSAIARAVARRPELLGSPRWHRIVTKIAADVCEGLHAAHELKDESGEPLGVVHRDVTPQNVFVTYDGIAKLVDFGVAFANDRMTRTTTGTLKGKFAYMAPEQLAGEAYDRRVDVWALGICTWELLAGRRLFRRRTEMETLLAIQSRAIAAPSSVVPEIPPGLDAVVLRALERDPGARYESARALGRDLVAISGALGAPVANADVADLMAELFRETLPAKMEVLHTVMEQAPVLRPRTITMPVPVARALASEDEHTDVRAVSDAGAAGAPPLLDRIEVPRASDARRPGQRGVTSVTIALAGVAIVAVVGLAVVAGIAVSRGEDAAAGPATELSTAASTTPAEPAPAPAPATVHGVTADAPASATATARLDAHEVTGEVAPSTAARAPLPAPARDRAAPRRAEPESGEVAITSPVWADVVFRGRTVGRTPTVLRLPQGTQRLQFRSGDGRVWSSDVVVRARERTRFRATPP